jgi:two-component system NtrC family sensor kinase
VKLLPDLKTSISTKLMLSFLLVILIISIVFMIVGVRLSSNRILSEAQEKVRNDLNSARTIYQHRLDDIDQVVRFTAERSFLTNAFENQEFDQIHLELKQIQLEARLDALGLTDENGTVLFRTTNREANGDDQSEDGVIGFVKTYHAPKSATIIISSSDLALESRKLADKAYIELIDTPLARPTEKAVETSGMMLKAAAPVFNSQDRFIGIVYGGILLNKNYQIVDEIKRTVYENVKYNNQDIGTATIFQDDLRISTNVRNEDGSRAIGTRVSEEVYQHVVNGGQPWINRAYVVNNWYITAYEPIRDVHDQIIGILYVGVLEQKYVDARRKMILSFLGITVIGIISSTGISYLLARRISIPIKTLVNASDELARGHLDTHVRVETSDELKFLAESFNNMADSLRKRDEQIKEYATQKVMQTEKLALIGQLSANVAHELNNPLQGILTFSHLMLEENDCQDPNTRYSLEKIVGQANRCRDIIRGLLDFSRQRAPDKTYCDINEVLLECISLVEYQALFHNIQINKNLQSDLPMAVIDPSQIERVFINMIINAAEAMEGSGYLTLSTRFNQEKDQVEIAFSDTGPGISEENLKIIFDPFFTTKEVGHGTGLGLAISYGIVKGHHGNIIVDSKLGSGTTFIVSLPLDKNGNNGAKS